MNLLEGVTASQKEAITHVKGPLLVVAGAGSGKTRVVARRVAYLIESGVEPSTILAVTFTNKAAEEMSERVRALSGRSGARVSTFHSFAARTLRRFAGLLGYRNDFTIYDTDDQTALVKDLLKKAGYERDVKPTAVRDCISRWKNDGLSQPREMQGDAREAKAAAEIFAAYNEALAGCGAMDFDDLLLKLRILLESHPRAREALLDEIRFLLVDEYQDTNQVQFDIARRLVARHHNIMATGDPDQSIYGWRGASIENILNFTEHFPDARVVKMEENFRSRSPILAVAGALIRGNRRRIERGIVATRGEGPPAEVYHAANEDVEASEVAKKIAELVSEGVSRSEIAILYRVNWMSRVYERTLRSAGIPYRLIQGTEFFKRREVRDVVAYVRLAANPHDELSAARVVNNPPRGIAPALHQRVVQARAAANTDYLQAAATVRDESATTPARRRALGKFLDFMQSLRATLPRGPVAVVQEVIRNSGLKEKYEKAKDAEERLANMEELLNAAAAYEARKGDEATVALFLEEIALASDDDALDRTAPAVSLMTLHAAKGLEFDVIFLVGLEEGLLPHASSRDEPEDIEEERRLAYVGITRARERLFLSAAASRFSHGTRCRRERSRFLKEIPSSLLFNPYRGEEEKDLPLAWDEGEKGVPADPQRPSGKLRVGDVILHEHFGVGTVRKLVGTGKRLKATIDFDTEGQMQIILAYAQIRKLGRR